MAKLKVVLNKKTGKEILQSQEMMQICQEHAEATAEAAGGVGYEVTTHIGKTRVNASVHANTRESIVDNYKNNTLIKSMR